MPDDNTPIPNTAYPIIDHIVKQEGQGTYNVYFKELNEVDGTSIKQWLKRGFSYNDLIAPGIPVEGINESSFNDFNKVAFTGSYDDLVDAPTIPNVDGSRPSEFNPIAFTGIVELGNVQVTDILDLRKNSYTIEDYNGATAGEKAEFLQKLRNLGGANTFIRGALSDNSALFTDTGTFVSNFYDHKGQKPSYIISDAGVFLVLNAERVYSGALVAYYKFDVASVNSSEYNFSINNASTNEAAGDILESIQTSSKVICFVFDKLNNVIYCKMDDVGGVVSYNDLTDKPTLFSGDYEDLENKPNIPDYNLDANDSDTDITGLADVATTGSFDDLEDKVYIVNFSQFTQRYNSGTDTYTAMTGTEYNNIYSLGLSDVYIENIDTIYNVNNEENISLKEAILNLVNEFFDNNKKCKFITSYNYEIIIENIRRNYSGQNLDSVSIISTPIIQDNLNTLLQDQTLTKQSILNDLFCLLSKSYLIVDFLNNTIYCKFKNIFPILNTDASLISNGNGLEVKISSKSNNKLSLITISGQEGLYVE